MEALAKAAAQERKAMEAKAKEEAMQARKAAAEAKAAEEAAAAMADALANRPGTWRYESSAEASVAGDSPD